MVCFIDNEIFQPVETGMQAEGLCKQVREDGKIDLALQQDGVKKVEDFSEVLLKYIKDNDGFTPLNDKSAAEEIYSAFGVSKKTFKKQLAMKKGNPSCLTGVFPIKYRKNPMNKWGVSIVGERISPIFVP